MQICVRYAKLRKQIFQYFDRNMCSPAPIFGGRTNLLIIINVQCQILALHNNYQDASPIFIVPEIYVKFDMFSGTMKIGLASFFECLNT